KSIRNDDSIKVEPVIDRDTQNVAGSPDIVKTIFEKIDEAQIFVCDVSIINKDANSRPTPNPNVLIELGYAMKTLGEGKIIMVMNTAFGTPEQLPFDLRMRRVIRYNMPVDNQ
ncbi:MAG: nucleotide-binding protein, partial [Okeania sp. SIO2D1]|nr:nucleotide-binding protein [Okeania sp. SIO2D1]